MPRRNKQHSHMASAEADVIQDGSPRDIVILVMGPSGAGKSTFINAVMKEECMQVGHSLTSCITKVNCAVTNPSRWGLEGRRLFMVDTPGFNDTYKSDAEILRRIAVWLAASYRQRMTLGGIIYLHDISLDKFSAADRRNLQMLKYLCGNAALGKVVLGTTKWDRVTSDTGEKREQELKRSEWKSMVDNGSKVHRFNQGTQSALKFLDTILHPSRIAIDTVLEIQRELVIDQKTVSETSAGRLAGVHAGAWWKKLTWIWSIF